MKKADLVIVSHNSRADLDRLLPSIYKFTQAVYTLTVVDNSDDKETREYLKLLNGIKAVATENKGYGSACNIGAAMGKAEFIVFMNSDLEVTPFWLEGLLRPFEDPQVAISGLRLHGRDGTEHPTPEKDFVIGACFAIRRSVFEKLKGFDERFFLFFEETDLCLRATKAGHKVVRSETSIIHHHPHFHPEIQADPFLKKCWDESKAYYEAKHPKKEKKCLIGIPCGPGMMSAYAVDGLYKMKRPVLTSLLIIERQPVDIARNYIIETALSLDVDYILFLDDDGVVPSDTLERLMESDKDIVGAPMMTRNARADGTHGLCCFEREQKDIGDGTFIWKYKSIKKFNTKKEHLFEVDAIGGACMLVKRKCFEEMFKKYGGKPFEFIHGVYKTEEKGITVRDVSEDICFSERAKELGFEIWVDTRVRPVHLGKPNFIRFEQKGEKLPKIKDPKCTVLMSESLK